MPKPKAKATPASSSNQPMPEPIPMETVNLSKNYVYSETGRTDSIKKGGRKAKGDEVVLAPPSKPSVNVPADSGSTPEKVSGVKTKFRNKKNK